MANEINPNLSKRKPLEILAVENKNAIDLIKIETGLLGRIWGNSKNIPHNVAGIVIILLLLSGSIYTCVMYNVPSDKTNLSIKDFWSIISPIITLALGYLFGNKSESTS
ncbi:hypothetical protein GCM10028819_33570 [Spirosoma humi]